MFDSYKVHGRSILAESSPVTYVVVNHINLHVRDSQFVNHLFKKDLAFILPVRESHKIKVLLGRFFYAFYLFMHVDSLIYFNLRSVYSFL